MVILLLTALSLFSTTTNCMKRKNQSIIPSSYNFYFDQNNIEKFGHIINHAAKSNNGYLTLTLAKICLPPEVVTNYINPYLAQFITKQYKHTIIAIKGNDKPFTTEKYRYNKPDRDIFSHHDGTYTTVPQTEYIYKTWEKYVNNQQVFLSPYNEPLQLELFSCSNHYNKQRAHSLIKKLKTDNKEFLLCVEGKLPETLTFDNAPSHYLFSNNSEFLLLGFPTVKNKNNLEIYKTETLKKISFSINGNISALCSAHRSPIFVVGSDDHSILTTPEKNYNLLYMSGNTTIWLNGINEPISHVTFNSDDTKLLSCSYDETDDNSCLIIWDTTNYNQIVPIYKTRLAGHIQKAFFTDNNRVVTVNKDESITIIKIISPHWHFTHNHELDKRLIVASNKNNLLISAFNNFIEIRESYQGNLLSKINYHNCCPLSLGLTEDEHKIIFEDDWNNINIITLYGEQDLKNIDFIQQANTIQLYTMLLICNHYKSAHKKRIFIKAIEEYVKKQQKKINRPKK